MGVDSLQFWIIPIVSGVIVVVLLGVVGIDYTLNTLPLAEKQQQDIMDMTCEEIKNFPNTTVLYTLSNRKLFTDSINGCNEIQKSLMAKQNELLQEKLKDPTSIESLLKEFKKQKVLQDIFQKEYDYHFEEYEKLYQNLTDTNNKISEIQSHPNWIAPNENTNEKAPPDSMKVLDISEFDGISPGIINENALNDLKIAVAKNPKVKGLLGNNYEFTDTVQRLTENDGWQPILNYYTDDRKYTVTVVMDKGKVVSTEKYENVVWGHTNAFTIDQYDDDRYDVSGIIIVKAAPNENETKQDDRLTKLAEIKKQILQYQIYGISSSITETENFDAEFALERIALAEQFIKLQNNGKADSEEARIISAKLHSTQIGIEYEEMQ